VGVSRDCPNFFEYPLLSQERVKLRTSTFVRTFLVSIGTSLLQFFGKVAGCVVRTLKTFQGTHILGASRGLLCDSSAVLFDLRCSSIGHLIRYYVGIADALPSRIRLMLSILKFISHNRDFM